jgi:MFS family permease
VNVALPDIQRALNSSFSDLQWIVDAYALTLAAFLLTAGSLAEMFGRRLLYLVGLAVFTFASVLCGFAVSTVMLQLSRALRGVGGAIMFAVSLALLADSFRGKDRVAFGAWGAVTGLAVAIGPLLGGVLTSGLSWRWIFVDDPRSAVELAAGLVDDSGQALVAFVKEQQDSLLAAWHGEDAGTEELRVALQRYRAFGTRLADFSRDT